MLRLSKKHHNQMIEHAKAEHPLEACGLLFGKDDTVQLVYPVDNLARSKEKFEIDPGQQLKAIKEARQNGLKMLGNYHSHPETPARPSKEDLRLAFNPDIFYLIVSLMEVEPVIKGFRIIDGVSKEIDLKWEDAL